MAYYLGYWEDGISMGAGAHHEHRDTVLVAAANISREGCIVLVVYIGSRVVSFLIFLSKERLDGR